MRSKIEVTGNVEHPLPIIREAWRRGVAALNPTPLELAHGLELHANLFACETFGFLPGTRMPPESVARHRELKEGNVGQRELYTAMLGSTDMTRNREAADEFLAALKASGLNCVVQNAGEGKSRYEDIKLMASFRQRCRVFRHALTQVGSSAEIREANARGQVGFMWSVNGPPAVGKLVDPDEELKWIEVWYNLGVRLMHITYNRRNLFGDGCAEPADGGLSELGRDLIAELNRVGIIVDVPHSGRQTSLDAARASSKPMMASHTAAKAVYDHIRCKDDEVLTAVADTDGLVGVYALSHMLGPQSDINMMLNHIDYIAKRIGVSHVAIGTDSFYQAEPTPGVSSYAQPRFQGSQWWGNWKVVKDRLSPGDESSRGSLAWTNWPLFTVGLVKRGYKDDEIAQVLGLNFLRVLDATRPPDEVVFDRV